LVIPKPIEKRTVIEKIHEEIGHFGESWTLVEVKKRFFWHDRTKSIKTFVKTCNKCQLARQFDMRFGVEKMKNITICDLFYQFDLETTRPLSETIDGNKYVTTANDHYSKCCEARLIKEHDVLIGIKFLEDGIPKYILIKNGSEWMKEFVEMC
jgi:hypothetical protein